MAIAMAKLGRDLCTLGEGARSKSGRVGARCLARARAPIAGGSRRAGRRPRFDWAGSRKMVVLRSAQFTASELQTVVVVVEASPPYRRLLRSEDARLADAAQDAMLGTERIQGHPTSALRCLDGRQPGSK